MGSVDDPALHELGAPGAAPVGPYISRCAAHAACKISSTDLWPSLQNVSTIRNRSGPHANKLQTASKQAASRASCHVGIHGPCTAVFTLSAGAHVLGIVMTKLTRLPHWTFSWCFSSPPGKIGTPPGLALCELTKHGAMRPRQRIHARSASSAAWHRRQGLARLHSWSWPCGQVSVLPVSGPPGLGATACRWGLARCGQLEKLTNG